MIKVKFIVSLLFHGIVCQSTFYEDCTIKLLGLFIHMIYIKLKFIFLALGDIIIPCSRAGTGLTFSGLEPQRVPEIGLRLVTGITGK